MADLIVELRLKARPGAPPATAVKSFMFLTVTEEEREALIREFDSPHLAVSRGGGGTLLSNGNTAPLSYREAYGFLHAIRSIIIDDAPTQTEKTLATAAE